MSDQFFVVTGGPGAGKTSLITELARSGFHTTPESGRAIIREEMQSGGDALPWADRMAYAERMLERDLHAYRAAQALSGPVICDRGTPPRPPPTSPRLPDALRPPVPPHVAATVKGISYNHRIFLAPFWDAIFEHDAERKQTRAVMHQIYTALGYEITELPCTDIRTRADFVCEQLAINGYR